MLTNRTTVIVTGVPKEGDFVKKQLAIFCAVVVAVLTISLQLFSASRHKAKTTKPDAASSEFVEMIAGPGQVEPVSEDIKLGSELSGKLQSVNVAEGDSVHKGEVLAALENGDYRAELASANAEVLEKEAMLRKTTNGAREQERAEARASMREAQAVMANAQAELARRQSLYQSGVISREELDHYLREYDVAKEQYQEKSDHYSLLNTASREEDVSFAQADLELARANAAEAQAKYEKTFIKSPIDGVVLRVHHRAGESVSNSAVNPDPVLTIGDVSVRRVRVDVDESDVNRVRVGQRAYVMADAYGKQKVWGRVVQVGELLGPKTIHTDEPGERVDRKFLETVVQLDSDANLPMGLRVDAFILTDGVQTAALRPQTTTMASARTIQ